MTSCKHDNLSNENTEYPTIASATDNDIIPGQYIVFFKESKIAPALNQLKKTSFVNREVNANSVDRISKKSIQQINTILNNNEINQSKVLNYFTSNISGVSIKLTAKEFEKLSRDKNVESITVDRIIEFPEFNLNKTTQINRAEELEQIIPCGIEMAGGFSKGHKKRTWIWIIDTGIDLDHPDLNVISNPKFARSFIKEEPSPDDFFGHGTHVAGTAAAIDNNFGVVGVSAGAPVVPVRVFSIYNRTSTSIMLAGINHVGKYGSPGDVVYVSLGNKSPVGSDCYKNSPYKTALRSLTRKGMFVTLPAGNNGRSARFYEPSCINGDGIFTIGAMDCNESFSIEYSNKNDSDLTPIDFIAVGTEVMSTYIDGNYIDATGTSMSAAHVAGIIHSRGRAPKISKLIGDNYGWGQEYPIAVRK